MHWTPFKRADGIIAVSPTFQASYSGFSSFWDLIEDPPRHADLAGAIGGTARHSLMIDFAMRPIFLPAHGHPAVSRVRGVDDFAMWLVRTMASRTAPLEERITRAGAEFAQTLASERPALGQPEAEDKLLEVTPLNKCLTPSTSESGMDSEVEVVPLELTSRSEEERKQNIRAAWRTFIETTGRLQDELDKVLREGKDCDRGLQPVRTASAPDHRLRFKDLAKRMSFSKSRLSYQVKVLDKRGLVCRRTAEEDARGLYVELTDAGMKPTGSLLKTAFRAGEGPNADLRYRCKKQRVCRKIFLA